MTDKTERSETMLPCGNVNCISYDDTCEQNCEAHGTGEVIECRCFISEATRPDAKDTAAEFKDARSMINQAYDIMEIWDTLESQYNTELKKEWLRKAREIHGAVPSL